jgi:hypothetical protein
MIDSRQPAAVSPDLPGHANLIQEVAIRWRLPWRRPVSVISKSRPGRVYGSRELAVLVASEHGGVAAVSALNSRQLAIDVIGGKFFVGPFGPRGKRLAGVRGGCVDHAQFRGCG